MLIGSLLLLVLLFPLFLLIAVLIKLDSPGPIFFRHYRVGKDGKHFVLWKFRSMRTDVPGYEALLEASGCSSYPGRSIDSPTEHR